MTLTTKILFGLFITCKTCNYITIRHDESDQDKNAADKYKSNVAIVNGKIEIDTMAIVHNTNLQSLINDLENTELTQKNTIADIPPFIKTFLDSLTGNFSIANPGENWQVGCVVITTEIPVKADNKKKADTANQISFGNYPPLPPRELIYLGLGKNIALINYYTGGAGKSEHILLIKFDNTKVIDFWCGNILTDVKSKEETLNYLKANKNNYGELNTGFIYL